MPVGQKIQLKVQQKLRLSPQVQYCLRLIQLNRVELVDHIQEAVLSNPLIEIESATYTQPQHLSQLGPSAKNQSHDIDTGVWAVDPDQDSLQAHLEWQLAMSGFDADEMKVASLIIHHLDDRGLLSIGLSELFELSQTEMGRRAHSKNQIKSVLAKIQQFDPIGVAAQTVQESLLMQLSARFAAEPSFSIAKTMLENHYHQLGQGDMGQLATALKSSPTQIQSGFALIQRLTPNPASAFGQLTAEHIIPDIYIYPSEDQEKTPWRVIVNRSHMPQIILNSTYKDLMPHASAPDKKYLNQKLRDAQSLIDGLQMRHQTIVRVAQALASYQTTFLHRGRQYLRPLSQKMIAETLDMHSSTISRTVSGKYAQTPQGLISLKQFFSGKLSHDAQGQIASDVILEKIREIIIHEDPKQPLTDQSIANLLSNNGVRIARRTVTKYREKLGFRGSQARQSSRTWRL